MRRRWSGRRSPLTENDSPSLICIDRGKKKQLLGIWGVTHLTFGVSGPNSTSVFTALSEQIKGSIKDFCFKH